MRQSSNTLLIRIIASEHSWHQMCIPAEQLRIAQGAFVATVTLPLSYHYHKACRQHTSQNTGTSTMLVLNALHTQGSCHPFTSLQLKPEPHVGKLFISSLIYVEAGPVHAASLCKYLKKELHVAGFIVEPTESPNEL